MKVVQYLVKEVNQFPSDIECMRYIATIADKVCTDFLFSHLSATHIGTDRTEGDVCRAIMSGAGFLLLQELLKKCHQCMETIVKAKDQQAAEANKNASILLKELDLEKVMSNLIAVLWEVNTFLIHWIRRNTFFLLWVTVPRGEQEAGPGC